MMDYKKLFNIIHEPSARTPLTPEQYNDILLIKKMPFLNALVQYRAPFGYDKKVIQYEERTRPVLPVAEVYVHHSMFTDVRKKTERWLEGLASSPKIPAMDSEEYRSFIDDYELRVHATSRQLQSLWLEKDYVYQITFDGVEFELDFDDMCKYIIFFFQKFREGDPGFASFVYSFSYLDQSEDEVDRLERMVLLFAALFEGSIIYQGKPRSYYTDLPYTCMLGLNERILDAMTPMRLECEVSYPTFTEQYMHACIDPFVSSLRSRDPTALLYAIFLQAYIGDYSICTESITTVSLTENKVCIQTAQASFVEKNMVSIKEKYQEYLHCTTHRIREQSKINVKKYCECLNEGEESLQLLCEESLQLLCDDRIVELLKIEFEERLSKYCHQPYPSMEEVNDYGFEFFKEYAHLFVPIIEYQTSIQYNNDLCDLNDPSIIAAIINKMSVLSSLTREHIETLLIIAGGIGYTPKHPFEVFKQWFDLENQGSSVIGWDQAVLELEKIHCNLEKIAEEIFYNQANFPHDHRDEHSCWHENFVYLGQDGSIFRRTIVHWSRYLCFSDEMTCELFNPASCDIRDYRFPMRLIEKGYALTLKKWLDADLVASRRSKYGYHLNVMTNLLCCAIEHNMFEIIFLLINYDNQLVNTIEAHKALWSFLVESKDDYALFLIQNGVNGTKHRDHNLEFKSVLEFSYAKNMLAIFEAAVELDDKSDLTKKYSESFKGKLLCNASYENRWTFAMTLLCHGVDPNVFQSYRTADGCYVDSPLCYYLVMGDLEKVRCLLEYGADINYYSSEYFSRSFVQLIHSGNVELLQLVQSLSRFAIDLKQLNNLGESLMWFASDVRMVDYLIDNGLDVNLINNDGESVLFSCVRSEQFSIARLFISKGVRLDTMNIRNETLLNVLCSTLQKYRLDKASEYGANIEFLNYLICADVDGNQYPLAGRLLLHELVYKRLRDSVELFVNHGGNIHLCDKDGNICLYMLIMSSVDLECDAALVAYLVGKGLDINKENNGGDTVLHQFIQFRCSMQSIRNLIENGADVHKRNHANKTPLQLAAFAYHENSIQIMQLLVEFGADLDSLVFGRNADDLEELSIDVASYLLKQGVNIFPVVQEDLNMRIINWLILKEAPKSLAFIGDLVNSNREWEVLYELLFYKAIQLSCFDFIKNCLPYIDVNAVGASGETPLTYACQDTFSGIFEVLLDHEKIDVNVMNRYQKTALFVLLGQDYFYSKQVTMLLDKGATLDGIDESGIVNLLSLAVGDNNVSFAEQLLDMISRTGFFKELKYKNLFDYVVRSANIDMLSVFLKYGLPEENDGFNKTAIFYTLSNSRENDLDVRLQKAQMLLDRGAQVNVAYVPDGDLTIPSVTLLHSAIKKDQKEHVSLFIQAGAIVKLDDVKYYLKISDYSMSRTLIAGSDLEPNEYQECLWLLIERTQSRWMSPDHPVSVFHALLQKGVDVHGKNTEGDTPVEWALNHQDYSLLHVLCENDALVDEKFNRGEHVLWVLEFCCNKKKDLEFRMSEVLKIKGIMDHFDVWFERALKYDCKALMEHVIEKDVSVLSLLFDEKSVLDLAIESESDDLLVCYLDGIKEVTSIDVEKALDKQYKLRFFLSKRIIGGCEGLVEQCLERCYWGEAGRLFSKVDLTWANAAGLSWFRYVINLSLVHYTNLDEIRRISQLLEILMCPVERDGIGYILSSEDQQYFLDHYLQCNFEIIYEICSYMPKPILTKCMWMLLSKLSQTSELDNIFYVIADGAAGVDWYSLNDEHLTPLWYLMTKLCVPSADRDQFSSQQVVANIDGYGFIYDEVDDSQFGLPFIRYVLENDQSVISQEHDNQSPLFWALAAHHTDLAKLFIDHGADIHYCYDQRTPFSMALEQGISLVDEMFAAGAAGSDLLEGARSLLEVLKHGDEERAIRLINTGCSIVYQDDGITPFMYAVSMKYLKVIELMKNKGEYLADPERTLWSYLTDEYLAVLEIIWEDSMLSLRNLEGKSVLDVVCDTGQDVLLKWLLPKLKDVAGECVMGDSLLWWAVTHDKLEIAWWVCRYGDSLDRACPEAESIREWLLMHDKKDWVECIEQEKYCPSFSLFSVARRSPFIENADEISQVLRDSGAMKNSY